MKILFVSTSSGSRGGGELYLLYLAKELAARGHDVHLLAASHPRMDEIASSFPAEITIHRATLRNTYDRKLRQVGAVLDIFNQRKYRDAIRQINPDILHINQQVAEDGLDLLLATRTLTIPCVTTIHITNSATELGARFAGIRDWLTRRVLSGTDIDIITVSSEMQRILLQRLGKTDADGERIHRVYNGVPCEAQPNAGARQHIRAEWGVEEGSPVIGTVGRIEHQKNPYFFLELVSALVSCGKIKKAVWIGDGRLRNDVMQRSREPGLADVVIFDGWRSSEEVRERLQALDIFVLPSRYEGLPLSLQEAMCAGLPVCVSDLEGMREAVSDGESGFLCPVDDKTFWLTRLERLADDEALRKVMGAKGRELIQQEFSISAMVDATLAVYDMLPERDK